MSNGLKIINLNISNLLRISAVDITPKDNTVIISGKNGQGKTSVLNAISFALGGKKLIPKEPIKEGEKTAKVVVDLGKYTVTRKWTANDKSYLKVTTKDGAQYPNPQNLLSELVGSLSFDPIEFANMCKDAKGQKKQKDMLLELVDIGINLDDMRKKINTHVEGRKTINKHLSQKQGELSGMLEVEKCEEDEVFISELLKELEFANNDKRQNNVARKNTEDKKLEIDEEAESLSEMEEELKNLQKQIAKKKELIVSMEIEEKKYLSISENLTDIDTSAIQGKIRNAETENARIRESKNAYSKRQEVEKTVAGLDAESREQTAKIEKINTAVKTALQNAKFPIDGLSINADGVTFNGRPFVQASDSEKLKVSMAIAMEMNPELRILKISNGESLDDDNLNLIKEIAGENDFQIWMEKVDSSGKIGIVIEDGQIKGRQTHELHS